MDFLYAPQIGSTSLLNIAMASTITCQYLIVLFPSLSPPLFPAGLCDAATGPKLPTLGWPPVSWNCATDIKWKTRP